MNKFPPIYCKYGKIVTYITDRELKGDIWCIIDTERCRMMRHGNRIGIQKEYRRLENSCLAGICKPIKLDRSRLRNSEICYIVQRMHGFVDCMDEETDAEDFTREVMKKINDTEFPAWIRKEMKTHPMKDFYPEWALSL